MSDCHLFLVKTLFSNFMSFIFYIRLVKHVSLAFIILDDISYRLMVLFFFLLECEK